MTSIAESPATGNTPKRPREIEFKSPISAPNGHHAPPVTSNDTPRPKLERPKLDAPTIRAALQCGHAGCECGRANGRVHCPHHDSARDGEPDLAVTEKNGETVWNCRVGCAQTDVTHAIIESCGHHTPNGKPVYGHASAPRQPSNTPPATGAPKVSPAAKSARKLLKTLHFDYHGADGAVLFQAERREYDNGKKDFLLRHRAADGQWVYKLGEVQPVLYRLPEVERAHTVFVVEGEKCADALNFEISQGDYSPELVATTNPMGALKWRETYSPVLAEKRVIILPDADQPGRDHAAKVAASVAPHALQVQVLELPDLPEKGDIFDFFASGGTLDTLIKLADEAPDAIKADEVQPGAAPDAATPAPNPFVPTPIDEVLQRPRPLWLVQDIFSERGTGLITGRAGSFKSLNVLDMGLCISLGRAWQGREVKQGRVVYVVAEGADTTADRVKAWKIRHQIAAAPDFLVIEVPAQIAEPDQRALFLAGIASATPALVIFDTLAQCNAGRNENDSGEMSVFTNAMKEISTALSCFVLTVHHNNKADSIRGSTSIEANTDAHISFKPSAGKVVTVHCERIKNSDFEPFSLIGRFVEIGERDEYDREVRSLVFEPTETPEKATTTTANERKCLEVLPSHGATSEDWFNLARDQDVSKPTFYRCRDSLRDKNEVFLSVKTGFYHPKSQSLTQSH